jgi:hypothetical protein
LLSPLLLLLFVLLPLFVVAVTPLLLLLVLVLPRTLVPVDTTGIDVDDIAPSLRSVVDVATKGDTRALDVADDDDDDALDIVRFVADTDKVDGADVDDDDDDEPATTPGIVGIGSSLI